VTCTLPGGQSISQAWSGALSVSGSTATVGNVSWNAERPAVFGGQANHAIAWPWPRVQASGTSSSASTPGSRVGGGVPVSVRVRSGPPDPIS
jgi:hypothetical protein